MPFSLLVFDNHTDMQPPAFGGLLSCGGWIYDSVMELPLLKRVILIGPDEEAFSRVESEIQEKVEFLSREKLLEMEEAQVCAFVSKHVGKLPLYISVDKDVLCKDDADTNWSQGGYAPGYDAGMSEESQRNMCRGSPGHGYLW